MHWLYASIKKGIKNDFLSTNLRLKVPFSIIFRLSFNVLFSFMVFGHLLFYSASNPDGLAANEATVSSFNIDSNLTQVSVIYTLRSQ